MTWNISIKFLESRIKVFLKKLMLWDILFTNVDFQLLNEWEGCFMPLQMIRNDITKMSVDAIVNAVVSGKADFGAAGMTVTDERKLSVDFTDTYATASQVIIVTK